MNETSERPKWAQTKTLKSEKVKYLQHLIKRGKESARGRRWFGCHQSPIISKIRCRWFHHSWISIFPLSWDPKSVLDKPWTLTISGQRDTSKTNWRSQVPQTQSGPVSWTPKVLQLSKVKPWAPWTSENKYNIISVNLGNVFHMKAKYFR